MVLLFTAGLFVPLTLEQNSALCTTLAVPLEQTGSVVLLTPPYLAHPFKTT